MSSKETKKKRKQTSRQNPYIGTAGQLAVMSELALRGYNVALPTIDKGDDVFVVNDHTRQLWRIQVKTATMQRQNFYQVVILERQIRRAVKHSSDTDTDLHFVFAIRREEQSREQETSRDRCEHWRFVVLTREQLEQYISERERSGKYDGKFGSLKKKDGRRTLGITFCVKPAGQVQCLRNLDTAHGRLEYMDQAQSR